MAKLTYQASFQSRVAAGHGVHVIECFEAASLSEAALKAEALAQEHYLKPLPYLARLWKGIPPRADEGVLVRGWLVVSVALYPEPPMNGPMPDEPNEQGDEHV